jgi:hypothetical protein
MGCSDESIVAVAPPDDEESVATVQEFTFANGLTVAVYSPAYLRERMTTLDGEPAIQIDEFRTLPVITDPDDPAIVNKGDGAFHAFSVDRVVATLQGIEHRSMGFRVNVYLLPYPRRTLLVSSTVGMEVFLSPHTLEIDPAIAAYIVAHELGHAFHNRFLPDGSESWSDYRRLRGIEDAAKFNESASHAYRPKEIFAEDFRALFGGPLARSLGGVENPELSSPESVYGLDRFFSRVAQVDDPPALRIGSVVPRQNTSAPASVAPPTWDWSFSPMRRLNYRGELC